jgi:hypothetical protein
MKSEQLVKDEITITKYTDNEYHKAELESIRRAHIPKVAREGNVAVLYSPGFGAGWYSWHGVEELLYDPVLVEMVEAYRTIEIPTPEQKFDFTQAVESHCSKYKDCYFGGADDLEVMWLPVGTNFRIHEYDGSETVEVRDQMHWMVA